MVAGLRLDRSERIVTMRPWIFLAKATSSSISPIFPPAPNAISWMSR
jgi:hypothetical protein